MVLCVPSSFYEAVLQLAIYKLCTFGLVVMRGYTVRFVAVYMGNHHGNLHLHLVLTNTVTYV